MLTSNPPTNPGGYEETRRTAHHVLQPRSHITSLPCHNRGCYLITQLTSDSLPGSLGTTNYHHFLRHNRGSKSKNSQTTLPSVFLLHQRLHCLVHYQLPYSHHVKDQERESTIQVGLCRITPCSKHRSLFQEELSRADNPNRTHREIRLDR